MMAQGHQVLFVSVCFYTKVIWSRSGILSRPLRFQRKCAWPQDDVPPVLPDRGVTQETTADLESHSQFDPTQKHFHASNCLREKAYVRPVICAWLKNSPAILTISFWLPLRAAQESNRLLQGKLWEESCDGQKHIENSLGFSVSHSNAPVVIQKTITTLV